jgi:hypothetical protein
MKEVFSSVYQDEALVVKSLLESAGLSPETFSDSLPVTVAFFSRKMSSIRVCVGDEEAEDAAAIVADYRSRKENTKGEMR